MMVHERMRMRWLGNVEKDEKIDHVRAAMVTVRLCIVGGRMDWKVGIQGGKIRSKPAF